jgi:hypothetical protein
MQLDSSELQRVDAFISRSLAICEVHESNSLLQLSKPLLLSILYLCRKRKQHELMSHYVSSPDNTLARQMVVIFKALKQNNMQDSGRPIFNENLVD